MLESFLDEWINECTYGKYRESRNCSDRNNESKLSLKKKKQLESGKFPFGEKERMLGLVTVLLEVRFRISNVHVKKRDLK